MFLPGHNRIATNQRVVEVKGYFQQLDLVERSSPMNAGNDGVDSLGIARIGHVAVMAFVIEFYGILYKRNRTVNSVSLPVMQRTEVVGCMPASEKDGQDLL